MHAIIDHSEKKIARTIHYHEQKVANGMAECLAAGNAVKDPDQLNRQDKIYHFERMNVRNDLVIKKTLHLSLVFQPSEKGKISNANMQGIAEQYLQKMGWQDQPYLIYRHYDTIQPHCHIVCTKIRSNGSELRVTRADHFKSKQLTRELEKQYSLVPSEQAIKEEQAQQLTHLQKVVYRTTPITPTFNRILSAVIEKYKYTSLPELNAVLGLYNMEAYRGKENGFVYQHKGLYYRTIVDNGKKDIRIKASILENKPTLRNLEKKFQLNQSESQRPQHRQRVMTAIDWTLVKSKLTLTDFKRDMEKERISVVLQQDKKGALFNLFYVDHQSKSVFDGSTLGNRYTAASIQQRCIPPLTPEQVQERVQQQKKQKQLDQEQELEL